MKNFRQGLATVLISTFVLIAAVMLGWAQEQPGNPDYTWLNGKWQGVWQSKNITDGNFVMELQVVNDNQIKDTGVVKRSPRGEKRGITSHTSISGTVNGNAVELVIAPGSATEGRKYSLSYVDGALKGIRGGKDQLFQKIE